MSKQVLPIKYPLITSLPAFANINAILSVHDEIYDPWFCQNYVQLVGWSDPEMYIQFFNPLFRKHYNLFDLHHIPKNIVEKWCRSFLELIFDELDNNRYIYISIDKFYIPAYHTKFHAPHDMLIYGYDRNDGIFHIADFFTSKYEFSSATFEEVEKAFTSSYSEGEWFKGIQTLEFNNKKAFSLEIKILIKHLTDYLEMNKSSLDYVLVEESGSDTDYWGIGVYQLLIDSLNTNNTNFTVLRSAHLLLDHKSAMLKRIQYLSQIGCISDPDSYYDQFERIKERMLIIRNLIIKQRIQPRDTFLISISKYIEENIREEEEAFRKLILDLKKTSMK